MTDSSAAALPGWYPDSDPAWVRYWDGGAWTEQRKPSDTGAAPAPAPQPVLRSASDVVQPPPGYALAPGGTTVRPLVPDGGGIHFLRFVLIYFAMALSLYILVGLIWWAIALSQTGRRKRDLLMLLIPFWNTVVVIQTVWRYTAKNVYWSARADRPSKSLFATT